MFISYKLYYLSNILSSSLNTNQLDIWINNLKFIGNTIENRIVLFRT